MMVCLDIISIYWIIYIYNNLEYEKLKKEIENKLIKMYDKKILSKKIRKKIFLLKLNTILYKNYRILSNKWKLYKEKRKIYDR